MNEQELFEAAMRQLQANASAFKTDIRIEQARARQYLADGNVQAAVACVDALTESASKKFGTLLQALRDKLSTPQTDARCGGGETGVLPAGQHPAEKRK
jgi:hypothetical protein